MNNNELTVEVLNASRIDYADYADLVNEAFAEVMQGANSSEVLNAALFNWKHTTPTDEGQVAFVKMDEKPVAANAMFPLTITLGNQHTLGWQSCDTSTLPVARGKGCFMLCLDALKNSLGEEDFFFGFPNANSIKGFHKIGWQEICDVRTWVRPLCVLPRRASKHVSTIERFGSAHDT